MASEISLIGKLQILQDFDDGVSDWSIEKITEIVNELKDFKIDSCSDFLNAINSRIAFWDDEKKKCEATKGSLETTRDNFKKYLNYALESTGNTKIIGTRYVLSRQTRTTLKPKKFDITSGIFVEFSKVRPGVIEHSYKINAAEFKKACEKSEELKEKYASEEATSFITFRANTKSARENKE